jgi:flagellar basal body rod protein FlgG
MTLARMGAGDAQMDPAYYVAAGSLKARAYQLDAVANNLANSQTVGYKTERCFFTVFNKAKHEGRGLPLSPFVNDGTIYPQKDIDFTQGPTKYTDRELDLALEGNGFFTIQTPQGNLLTRDGRFTLGPNGQLETIDGMPVLGKNGPITLSANGAKPIISQDGSIYQGNVLVDQLDIKAFEDTTPLTRAGWGRFEQGEAVEGPIRGRVFQGYLEQSGVDMAGMMVEMIRLNRLFEMSQKIASTLTNDLDARSNTIGAGQ